MRREPRPALEEQQAPRALPHPGKVLVPGELVEAQDKPVLQLVAVDLDPLHNGGELGPPPPRDSPLPRFT